MVTIQNGEVESATMVEIAKNCLKNIIPLHDANAKWISFIHHIEGKDPPDFFWQNYQKPATVLEPVFLL